MYSNKIKISRQQLRQIQSISSKALRAVLAGDNKLFATREVLNKLIYLIFLKSNAGQYSSHYVCPSMAWIGQQVFRSDETAHRIINQLVNLKMITKLTKRKAYGGNWTTNAYYPGAVLGRIIDRLLNPHGGPPLPSVKNDHQILLPQVINRPEYSKSEIASIFDEIKSVLRGGGNFDKGSPQSA